MRKKLLVIAVLLFTLLAAKVTCNAAQAEMLQTTNFKSGLNLPWHISESNEMNSYGVVENGFFAVHIMQAAENKWDIQIRHRELSIVQGKQYTIHFKLHAEKPQKIYVKVGDMGDPYNEAWSNDFKAYEIPAGGKDLDVTVPFTAKYTCKSAEFAFHFGGPDPYNPNGDCTPPEGQIIYFEEMSLKGEGFVPTPVPTATPDRFIRVNQLGYYPNAVKRATITTESASSALDVQLKDNSGKVVWNGKAVPKSGKDIASGEYVQIVDFSDFTTPGKDYQLVAGNLTSFKFDIGLDMYSQMKYDALKYFYHARSGIQIKMPYCEEDRWARNAGHTNDTVTQFPKKVYVDENGDPVPYNGPSSINGTGGWYDAGDHGKYVVNGGISTWTVLNQYERAKHSKNPGALDPYADDTMNIPESGNGVPDLLDEARWNVEYFLKVQTTSGDKPGMVIHKLADEKWTALGVKPEDDDQKRYYYPVSTAATLNFAAVTAQASRLFEEFDSAFASKCLQQAEKAWDAAVKNPDIYAPFGQEAGSGTYGDNYVGDEFYWAACELFITTGDQKYLDYLKSSKHSLKCPTTLSGESNGTPGSMDWGNTAACGTIDLVLCKPDGLSQSDLDAATKSMAAAADTYLAVQAKEGYEVPLEVSTYTNEFGGQSEIIENGYPWGSNSFIVNQSMVIAYAYDFTGDRKYIDGVTKSMDYLMGRNPNIKCYVSGYGENPLKYPHHRFFCPQIDDTFPSTPPGFMSGGPNSGCQDPWAGGLGLKVNKVAAQKCYVDHVESWSTNEVTINWNAPLAWLTGYLDEVGPRIGDVIPSDDPSTPPAPPKCYDVDKNGFVNIADIMAVAVAFNTASGDAKFVKAYDFDNNGAVNIADLMAMLPYFNKAV